MLSEYKVCLPNLFVSAGAPPERFQANEGENIQDVVARLDKEQDERKEAKKLIEVAQGVKALPTKVSSGVKKVAQLGHRTDAEGAADVV